MKIVLIILAVVLVLAAVAFGLYHFYFKGDKPSKKKLKVVQKKKQPPPPPPTCPICGVPSTSDAVERQPLAIMVENSPSARPQSALTQACLVAEALAEGGVTRFLAIYVHSGSEEVGPVRSARTYYLQLVLGFDALYAHCGGSASAMAEIKNWGVKDLDQFFHPKVYWRVKFRRGPHNLYTSTVKLREEGKRVGYTKGEYQGYKHKKEEEQDRRPQAQNITIDYSFPTYKVQYQYNRDLNAYLRWQGGRPHTDKIGGAQLQPKNVVIVYAPTSSISGGEGLLDIDLVGSGRCQVARDGQMVEGTWQKPALTSPILFYDSQGNELSFNPGQIWLEIVKPDTAVSYESNP